MAGKPKQKSIKLCIKYVAPSSEDVKYIEFNWHLKEISYRIDLPYQLKMEPEEKEEAVRVMRIFHECGLINLLKWLNPMVTNITLCFSNITKSLISGFVGAFRVNLSNNAVQDILYKKYTHADFSCVAGHEPMQEPPHGHGYIVNTNLVPTVAQSALHVPAPAPPPPPATQLSVAGFAGPEETASLAASQMIMSAPFITAPQQPPPVPAPPAPPIVGFSQTEDLPGELWVSEDIEMGNSDMSGAMMLL